MGQYDSWDYLTNFIKKYPDSFEEELAKPPLAIKVKRHPERANLVMFRYSQYESDFTNPVVRCCRGSVYDISFSPEGSITVKPYLMPFFKFNNYGENSADPINWNSTLYVWDKLDGSLLKLLKEPGGNDLWTTNRSFDIDALVPVIFPSSSNENLPPPYTFAGLRDYALRGHEEEIKHLPEGWVFMFELTSPYNRIVVPYSETKLTLLGCRDPQGLEHNPEWAVKNFGMTIAIPQIYKFKNIDEVITYCKSVDSNDREGVVLQDENYNRVKIKTEHYISLFYLKGEDYFSDSRIFEAIRQGSIDDALAAWPEIIPRAEEITAEWVNFRNSVFLLCEKASVYYKTCIDDCALTENDPASNITVLKTAKKHYAMYVMERYQIFSSFLFEVIKENANLEKIFNKIEYKDLKNFWIPAIEAMQL